MLKDKKQFTLETITNKKKYNCTFDQKLKKWNLLINSFFQSPPKKILKYKKPRGTGRKKSQNKSPKVNVYIYRVYYDSCVVQKCGSGDTMVCK